LNSEENKDGLLGARGRGLAPRGVILETMRFLLRSSALSAVIVVAVTFREATGFYANSLQFAAPGARLVGARAPLRADARPQVTCGLKDVFFSWRNSRRRNAQSEWQHSMFARPRAGTREQLEEEELALREEAKRNAWAQNGNIWDSELIASDKNVAVDEEAAAAARARRAQMMHPEELAQVAHSITSVNPMDDLPSVEERRRREEEAAADMHRVLGTKFLLEREAEVSARALTPHSAPSALSRPARADAPRCEAQAAAKQAEKEEALRRAQRAAEQDADALRTLGPREGVRLGGLPGPADNASDSRSGAAPGTRTLRAPPQAGAAAQAAARIQAAQGAPIRQRVGKNGQGSAGDAGPAGAAGEDDAASMRAAGSFAPASYITKRYQTKRAAPAPPGRHHRPTREEEMAAAAAAGEAVPPPAPAALTGEDPAELAARRGRTLGDLVAEQEEEAVEAKEGRIGEAGAAAEAPLAGGMSLADAMALAHLDVDVAPPPAPAPAPARAAAPAPVRAPAGPKGRWKVTAPQGLEVCAEPGGGAEVVGRVAGFTVVTPHPPPLLSYESDTPRPSLRTNRTHRVPLAGRDRGGGERRVAATLSPAGRLGRPPRRARAAPHPHGQDALGRVGRAPRGGAAPARARCAVRMGGRARAGPPLG
jgi:hypothetical protein